MEYFVKKFDQLTTDELYEILKVRVNVFVVEQNCPYSEIDDIDKSAYHVFLKDGDEIVAYLRVYERDGVRIGRVLTTRRRQGYGAEILHKGVLVAKQEYATGKIIVEAQTYVRTMYEKAGFVQVSDAFFEDGIEHIRMELKL